MTASLDLHATVEALLLEREPAIKARSTCELHDTWTALDAEARDSATTASRELAILPLDEPGRPARPTLVDPSQLPRRGLGSQAGRVALLHSLAHIEFNAINLALDAIYRFRELPSSYIDDWLKVAADEGTHFLLLDARLQALDGQYGELPAHDGLWDMARRTRHDVLVRMALVPRILEARGLDVAPPMMQRLSAAGDTESADILERIYTDEITHVAVGNRWFRYVCEQRELDGAAVFRDLLAGQNSRYLRSPYNDEARLSAGFTIAEMQLIREMEAEYQTSLQT